MDEFASGLPGAGANALKGEFSVDHAELALIVLVIPLVGALIEAPLIALADRGSRRRIAASIGLAGMAASLCACALAQSAIGFALAYAIYGPMSGLATSAAQASLMASDSEQRERRMTQWALAGVAGDVFAPLAMGAARLLGLGWRSAFFAGAALLLCGAVGALFTGAASIREDGGEEADPRISVRAALRNPRLLAWLAGEVLCSLLDETLATFAVLLMRERHGGGPLAETALLAAFTIAQAVSLAALDRLLLRRAPLPILAASSLACTAVYLGWLASPSIEISIALFALVGFFAAPLYPIAKAQAYRAVPSQPGLANALATLFLPFDLGTPLLLGLIADRAGIRTALLLLVLQPIGLFVLALSGPAGDRRRYLSVTSARRE